MTNNRIDKDIKKYLKAIKKDLDCYSKYKKKFLHSLHEDIESYIEENKNATIDDITAFFGSPECVAAEFIEPDRKKIKKAVSKKNVLICAVCIALAMLAIYLIVSFIDGHKAIEGYGIEGITDNIKTEEYIKEAVANEKYHLRQPLKCVLTY